MKEFGLQIYSIRDHFTNPEDTRESFRKMQEYGYSHAQTAGTYSYMPPEEFKALADEYGIKLMGTHYDWNLICNDVEGTVKYHKTIGAEYVGIGGMPVPPRTDKQKMLEFIDKFNEMARIYVQHGFKGLTYHNHSFEFKKFDGKTIMEYLLEGFDPTCTAFTLDTFWLQMGGEDICSVLRRLNGRVACVHLKDMEACHEFKLENGQTIGYLPERVEVGNGCMNFKHIIKVAEECGCKYFTVEDEIYSTGESYDSIRISAENIKAQLLDK